MKSRLGLILLGLVAGWGCDLGGPSAYSEPPAHSHASAVFQLHTAPRPIAVEGARVAAEFWGKTEVRPALGRLFMPEEYASADQRVVVLSHDLWEQSFHSDPRTIGQTIDLNGVPTTVVGVLPPEFHFPERARLWVPKTAGSE
jgi:MacB-like periplasmic core domain